MLPTSRRRQRRQFKPRTLRSSILNKMNPRKYQSHRDFSDDGTVPPPHRPTSPPAPPSEPDSPTVPRRDSPHTLGSNGPQFDSDSSHSGRRRPPKRFRDAVIGLTEPCKPVATKRTKSDDPDPDPDQQSTTAPQTSASIPPTSSSHSKSDKGQSKSEEVCEKTKRMAAQHRQGLLSFENLIVNLNKELRFHPLFSEDFCVVGDSPFPTAHNAKLTSPGQLSMLNWLISTGAIVEVQPNVPAYLEFFCIEKKSNKDSWRPLVNGREMKSRGVYNPSIRFTASATQALRNLATHQWRWVSDLTNGFQLVRCKTSPVMTTRINGRVFLLLSPAQGFPQSPSACNFIFEKEARAGGATCVYADNFGGSAPTYEAAIKQKLSCIQYMQRRGFTINCDETLGPAQQLEFLGVCVNENLLTLPADKREKLTKIISSGDKAKLDGYYAYLRDLFGNEKCVRKSITPTQVYFDGAKGLLSAAVCFCKTCEKPVELLTRSARQKDQVTSEVNASILAGVLARKYGCPEITGDALYLVDAQRKSSTRPTIAEIITKKLPPIKFVRSEHNKCDPFSRGITPQLLCSC